MFVNGQTPGSPSPMLKACLMQCNMAIINIQGFDGAKCTASCYAQHGPQPPPGPPSIPPTDATMTCTKQVISAKFDASSEDPVFLDRLPIDCGSAGAIQSFKLYTAKYIQLYDFTCCTWPGLDLNDTKEADSYNRGGWSLGKSSVANLNGMGGLCDLEGSGYSALVSLRVVNDGSRAHYRYKCAKTKYGGAYIPRQTTPRQDLNIHSDGCIIKYDPQIQFLDRAEIKCPEGTILSNGYYEIDAEAINESRCSSNYYWSFAYHCLKPYGPPKEASAAVTGDTSDEEVSNLDDVQAPISEAVAPSATPPASGTLRRVGSCSSGAVAVLATFVMMFFAIY
jgi:hypothetical protein